MKSKNSPSASEIKTKTKAPRLRVGLKGVGHDEFAAAARERLGKQRLSIMLDGEITAAD